MELEIHPIQTGILLVLLFKPKAKYSELNTTGMSTDHFNFHVKRLLKLKLINKTKNGKYTLTKKGKEFANRFDTESVVLEKQAKIGVLVIGIKKVKGKTYFLMQKRLKQPYFGYLGFVSGKVRWGETIIQAAKRELKEETNVDGNLSLVGIMHSLIYSKNHNELLEDKFFYVVKATQVKGKLTEEIEGAELNWVEKSIASNNSKVFYDFKEIMTIVNANKLRYYEYTFIVSGF